MNRYAVRLLSILLLLLSFLAGCSGARRGISATLEPGPAAPLGGEMAFKATVSYSYDVPNDNGASGAELVIGLPDGVQFLDSGWTQKVYSDGSASYTRPATFQANVPQTFTFHVRLTQPGTKVVTAGVSISFGTTGQDGNDESKVLDVSATGTTVRDMPLVWPTDQATP